MQNIRITHEDNEICIAIRKKYELALYLFLLFAFVFIVVVLFYLIPLAKENNPDSESNVLEIVEALFYIVGSIMLIGAIRELLKREWIEISKSELVLGNTILGHHTSGTRYLLKNIYEIKLASPPVRGWRVEDEYKDADRWKRSYSNDIRKVYPTICFQHNGEDILFANGLKPEEANEIITIIKKHTAHR